MNNKLVLEIAENLRNLANSIEIYARETHNNASQDVLPVTEASAPVKEEIVTLEQVRAALAEKSQSGKQPQVKALIQKYGGNKLTDLDPSCYVELIKEARTL